VLAEEEDVIPPEVEEVSALVVLVVPAVVLWAVVEGEEVEAVVLEVGEEEEEAPDPEPDPDPDPEEVDPEAGVDEVLLDDPAAGVVALVVAAGVVVAEVPLLLEEPEPMVGLQLSKGIE
jgi:hypothetical protein